MTAVVALALLLATSASVTVVVTVAVLMIEAAAYPVGTWNVATIVRVCPAGIVPSAHGNAVVQSPVFPTNVNPLGVGSDTVTPGASLGPWLRGLMRVAHVLTRCHARRAHLPYRQIGHRRVDRRRDGGLVVGRILIGNGGRDGRRVQMGLGRHIPAAPRTLS